MAWLESEQLEIKILITSLIEFGHGANSFELLDGRDQTPESPLTLVKVLHMVAQ